MIIDFRKNCSVSFSQTDKASVQFRGNVPNVKRRTPSNLSIVLRCKRQVNKIIVPASPTWGMTATLSRLTLGQQQVAVIGIKEKRRL